MSCLCALRNAYTAAHAMACRASHVHSSLWKDGGDVGPHSRPSRLRPRSLARPLTWQKLGERWGTVRGERALIAPEGCDAFDEIDSIEKRQGPEPDQIAEGSRTECRHSLPEPSPKSHELGSNTWHGTKQHSLCQPELLHGLVNGQAMSRIVDALRNEFGQPKRQQSIQFHTGTLTSENDVLQCLVIAASVDAQHRGLLIVVQCEVGPQSRAAARGGPNGRRATSLAVVVFILWPRRLSLQG